MIVDIVSYLIRQTPRYAEAGSIVVLCAYLGQLVRLRDAFSRLFTVVIDERDQSLLEDRTGDEQALEQDTSQVERVMMSQRVPPFVSRRAVRSACSPDTASDCRQLPGRRG